jgi:hypothetical protein
MPESFAHADFKSDLYWSLVEETGYAEIEKGVGRTRTDVLTEINGCSVAIEIQHTRIPIASMLRRMREHTKAGMHTLWLTTPEALLHGERCRHLNWVMFMQRLQGGVIFFPGKEGRLMPARVDNTLVFRKGRIEAGKAKMLETQDAISLDDLTFYRSVQHGVNASAYDGWRMSEL